MEGEPGQGRADRAHEAHELVLRRNGEGAEEDVDAAAAGLEFGPLKVIGLEILTIGLEDEAAARDGVHRGGRVEARSRVAALKAGVVIELLKEPGLRGAGRECKEDEERQKRRLWQMRCK